jgi:hypothetical protein
MQKGILKSYDKAWKQFSNAFGKLCAMPFKNIWKKKSKNVSTWCERIFWFFIICTIIMIIIVCIKEM